MKAWNGWYHVNSNTYGTWLRGDPRGWRTRHHREHVEGDYRHPPAPGTGTWIYRQSQRFLKTPPVHLTFDQRRIAVKAIAERLIEQGTEVLVVSVDAVHYHVLARFADDDVRIRVGKAKKHAWHLLAAQGLKGRAWAKQCRALPVQDRSHQVNVFNYIRDHREKGAWVWTFRDGMIAPDERG